MGRDIRSFMNQEDQYKLAHYLLLCMRHRQYTLVRLAERNTSTGSGWLRPDAGMYLDDFESEDD
jgi:hypothetical protein